MALQLGDIRKGNIKILFRFKIKPSGCLGVRGLPWLLDENPEARHRRADDGRRIQFRVLPFYLLQVAGPLDQGVVKRLGVGQLCAYTQRTNTNDESEYYH